MNAYIVKQERRKQMNNKKKTLLVVSTTFALGLGAIIPLAGNSKPFSAVFGADECTSGEHFGYHYAAKDPTCTEPGNLEFWACCDCHHQYLTNPGGTFIDRPVDEAVGGIGPDHIAYVAPTGEHKFENRAFIEDGNVNIYYACSLCDEKASGILNTMVAKRAATVTPRFELANPFVDNGDGSFTSMAIGHSSGSYMELVVDESGTLTINYDVSSENNWDWLDVNIVGDSNKIIHASGTKTDSVTFEVTAGQIVKICYSKDSGGSGGRDNAIITLGPSQFKYNVITFDSKGGTEFAPEFIENGKILGELPVPTKAGAYFEGWYLEETFETSLVDVMDTVDFADVTVYAKYSEPLHVTFHTDGGTVIPNVNFQQGTTPVLPADPEKSGYVFLGWYTDDQFNDPYVAGNANASFDLYAKWFDATQMHTLSGTWGGWKASGTSGPTTSYAEMEVTVTGAYRVREYYNTYHEGTFDAVSGSGIVDVATDNDGTAIYDSVRDIVVFVKDSDTVTSSFTFFVLKRNAASSTAGTSYKMVKNVSANDTRLYSFTDGSDTIYIFVDCKEGKFIYNASIENFDGTPVNISSISATTCMGFVVKENGHVFGTYNSDGTNFETIANGYHGVYHDDTLGDFTYSGNGKALWPDVSSGAFDAEYIGSSSGNPILYVKYAAIYRYLVTIDTTAHTYTAVERTTDVTLDLNYEGAPAASTFSVVYEKYVTVNEFAPAAATPTRTGYVFDGWYTEANGGSKVGNRTYTEVTTLYAHWLKEVTVSFAETDDSAVVGVSPVAGVEGSAVGTLPTPEKSGFVFGGWFVDKAFETPFTASSVFGSTDTTVYAKWLSSINATFHSNVPGNDTTVVVSTLPDTAIVAPVFTYAGHYVEGYYAEQACTTAVNLTAGIPAAGDIYVKWAEGVAATGTYKGYNLYSTGSQTKAVSDLGMNLTVSADGAVSGNKTATVADGVNASITVADNQYFYFNELGILWTAYSTNKENVGTDTNIFFRDTDFISSLDVARIGSIGGHYAFVARINYIDGSSVLITGYNDVIYDNVTLEGKTFAEIQAAGSSASGFTVKDKLGNDIFSK